MSVVDLPFVLPDDVDAVTDPATGDVLLARRGSRHPAQVLSREAWALLEAFREPRTLAAGVVEHCRRTGAEPLATLETAFPVLVALTHSEVLVPAEQAAELVPRYPVGGLLGPARLVRTVRVLRDGELWEAVLPDGTPVVVKVVDDDVVGPELVAREVAALRMLAGGPVPELLWQEGTATGGVLVLSFVDALPVDLAPLDGRGRRDPAVAGRVALALLEAYADLHSRGILHGDVHPGNVLADDRGRVTVLDFGVADVPGLLPAPRAGGGEGLDPLAARAVRDGTPMPPLDEAAEVYSVAALAYRVLTGTAALDLDREREASLTAILEEAPRSFTAVGRPAQPAVEAVLRRGLAKDPAERFASVAALRDALAGALAQPAGSGTTSLRTSRPSASSSQPKVPTG